MTSEELSVRIRLRAWEMGYKAKASHMGGNFSMADAISVLYTDILNIDPKDPDNEGRDRVILSKGHCCAVLYALLAEKGFFPVEDLTHCKDIGFYLQGHPHLGTPGIEAGTGSLGQGLSLGSGIAIGLKLDRKLVSLLQRY